MNLTAVREIISDNKSSSIQIVNKINRLLLRKIKDLNFVGTCISIFSKELSSFGAVKSYTTKVERFMKAKDYDGLKHFLKNYEKQNQNKYYRIYLNAQADLNKVKCVMTISNSATIVEVFKYWIKDQKHIKIFLCESRPMNEGRRMAKRLLKLGIEVHFITEAMAGKYIKFVDAVIIGADKVLRNGNVINKMGSKVLAVLAKYFQKPFFVLTDRSKFVNSSKSSIEINSPKEIWGLEHKLLKIKNEYFEEVDKKFITKLITD